MYHTFCIILKSVVFNKLLIVLTLYNFYYNYIKKLIISKYTMLLLLFLLL